MSAVFKGGFWEKERGEGKKKGMIGLQLEWRDLFSEDKHPLTHRISVYRSKNFGLFLPIKKSNV